MRERLMQAAIAACRDGIRAGQSPFGAVIAAANGDILTAAHNTVRLHADPTAHAEINAIRAVCRSLGKIDLSGYVIATTCEPCPMCAAAIHWARLGTVYYGASIDDAAEAGFNELHVPCRALYETGGSRLLVEGGTLREECKALFDAWRHGPNPLPY